LRWTLKTIERLQWIDLFLKSTQGLFPSKIMNGINIRHSTTKNTSINKLESEIINELHSRNINFISNFKMLDGTFKVKLILSKK